MQLNLKRLDLGLTSTSELQTLQVLPKGQDVGHGQAVVVGDSAGVLQGFFYRNGEYVQIFKNAPGPRKINCIVTGLGKTQRDKVFVAEGSVVKAFDRKGAQFFRFTTPITEEIFHLEVFNTSLFAFTHSSVTVFEETTEKCFFLAPERITCATVMPLAGPSEWAAVIGCQDCCIRVLDGSRVLQEIPLEAAPSALAYFPLPHDAHKQHPTRKELFVGLENGGFDQFFLDPATHHRGVAHQSRERRGAVAQLFSAFDMMQNGMNEIVVGRDDGNLEVYDMTAAGELELVWQTNIQQSIHSVRGGNVTSLQHEEYVVQTYAGALISFTAGNQSISTLPGAAQPATEGVASVADKAARVVAEIEALDKEIKHMQALAEEQRRSLAKAPAAAAAPVQALPVKHSLRYNVASGEHELSIEATAPIFCVAVACTAAVEFHESVGSVAILTTSPPQRGSADKSLATYRCHDAMQRVVIAFRVEEGVSGTISAYIVPKNAPKVCSRITAPVHSLSLHHRIRDPDPTRPFAHFTISGDFLAADVHLWLLGCLPDLPKQTPAAAATKLMYGSAALQTQVMVSYQDHAIKASSDNVCALMILRDTLTRAASDEGMRIKVLNDVRKETIVHFVGTLWPRIREQSSQQRTLQLREALQELTDQENDKSFLTKRMQAILDQGGPEKAAGGAGAGMKDRLDWLMEQVCKTHVEWCRQEGRNAAEGTRDRLLHVLSCEDTKLDDVLEIVLYS